MRIIVMIEYELEALRAEFASRGSTPSGLPPTAFQFCRQAFLRVDEALPSRIRKLAEIMRDKDGGALNWKGKGEE